MINVESIGGNLIVQHYRPVHADRSSVEMHSPASRVYLFQLVPYPADVRWILKATPKESPSPRIHLRPVDLARPPGPSSLPRPLPRTEHVDEGTRLRRQPHPTTPIQGASMLYSAIVKKRIRQSFDQVNNHRWDELMNSIAPNVHHRFLGAHAIGGERHDRETLRRWFERLARVLPNLQLKINDIWVKGWPWHTTVFVQWDGAATLLNGGPYIQHAVHVITLRWGKIHALDVFEDSQEVARALAAQAAAGLEEAAAEPIVSYDGRRSDASRLIDPRRAHPRATRARPPERDAGHDRGVEGAGRRFPDRPVLRIPPQRGDLVTLCLDLQAPARLLQVGRDGRDRVAPRPARALSAPAGHRSHRLRGHPAQPGSPEEAADGRT